MVATREEMLADLAARSRRLQDPAARAQQQEQARERNLQGFEQRYPGSVAWMQEAAQRGFHFAQDMLRLVHEHGHLTDNQRDAVLRCMAKDKERAEQRAADDFRAQEMARPVHAVNLLAVEQAFQRAKASGIKWPKLTLDGFQLKPAGENSRNAGSIYVTKGASRDGLYLGKVLRGAFEPSRDCDERTRDSVLEAMADPLASAIAYGKKFGRCSVCNRELTDEESIERGIGPVCADRMGWA